MTLTPWFAAAAGATAVAVAVAFVLRPAQLAPPAPSPPSAAPASPNARAVENAPAAQRPQTLVYVAGAVVHPGVYAVGADARGRDALAKAGGPARDADLVAVNLAAHVADGDEIAVPRMGDAARTAGPAAHRRTAAPARRRRRPRRATRSAASVAPGVRAVDLNSASASELAELPGVGPALAERIVEFRSLNGAFPTVDALADVAGFTPQRLDALTPWLTAGR